MNKLDEMLEQWDKAVLTRDTEYSKQLAIKLIHELRVTLAGKDAVIEALKNDIQWYKTRNQ